MFQVNVFNACVVCKWVPKMRKSGGAHPKLEKLPESYVANRLIPGAKFECTFRNKNKIVLFFLH